MVALLPALLPLPISPAPDLIGRLVAVLLATLATVVVLFILRPREDPADLDRLLRHARRRATFADQGQRARRGLRARLRVRLRARLALAGFGERGRPWHVVAATGASATLAGLLTWALLGAPPFAAAALLAGLGAPWAWLGARARRRAEVVERQVVDALGEMASAAATGASPQQALMEMVAQQTADPLAGHLWRATRDLDRRQGLSDRSFAQVMTSLDEGLASPAFTLAARAIRASVEHNVALAQSLEEVVSLAGQELAFRGEARADFAYNRAASLLLFSLPLGLTVVLRWLLPTEVAAAYSSPVGWAVAAALCGWCLLGYSLATAPERRTLRRPGGPPR